MKTIEYENTKDVSDGYHTFEDLYEHRHALFVALSNHTFLSWKSRRHHKGGKPMYKDYFIAGLMVTDGEQISYHLPIKYWDIMRGAEELDYAPEWDGHTSKDVVSRLLNF